MLRKKENYWRKIGIIEKERDAKIDKKIDKETSTHTKKRERKR